MLKRLILVLTVTAMMLIGSALPALAYHEETGDPAESPENPRCGWYPSSNEEEEWWEYWCRWPHWGWEYVFWTY